MIDYLNSLRAHRQFIIGFILALTFSLLVYNKIILSGSLLAFPDLGTFPLPGTQGLNILIFSWNPQNFGFYGPSLPYILFVWAFVYAFGSALGEHVWLLSFFLIGYISAYSLLSLTDIEPRLRVLFSILYIFNPVVSGLIYEASINDTLTLYVLFPALIALAIKVYSKRPSFPAVLAFAALTTYAYFWNPQVVMWVLPVILVALIGRLAKERNFKALFQVVLSTAIFLLIFLTVTGSLEIFIQVVLGRAYTFFTITQTTSPYNILIDLRDNFYGQFPLFYSYILLNWSAVLTYFWVKFRGTLNENEAMLLAVSIAGTMIVNFTWLIFRSNFIYLQLLLAKYFPLLGAYEPFFGC